MSVKFDFNKMETEGDPEAWVVFNCSMCATPECQYEDDSGSVLSIVNILKYSLMNFRAMIHFIGIPISLIRNVAAKRFKICNILCTIIKSMHSSMFVFHYVQLYF